MLPYFLERCGVEFRFLDFQDLQNKFKFIELENQVRDLRPDFIFFTWLQDIQLEIEKINEICARQNTYFGGLSSLSYVLRPKLRFIFQTSFKIESRLIKQLQSSSQAIGVISWDPKASILDNDNLAFPTILNFYLDVPSPDPKLISRFIQKVRLDSKKVGFFGHLLPQRGLISIFVLSVINPNCDFILVGKRGSFNSKLKSNFENVFWQALKMRGNCFIFDDYVNNTSLISLINYVDFVFLDATSYPNPSGIVDLARKLGKQVLIKSSNSAIYDIYNQDSGVIPLRKYRIKALATRNFCPSNSIPTAEEAISSLERALEKLYAGANKRKISRG
jgi:hypothetical protein